jgi:phosphoenolpyruvate carboxylase
MTSNKKLHQHIQYLSGLLDTIIEEQAGRSALLLVRELRQLALERRVGSPGAEERLAALIQRLNESEIRVSVRALSLYFDLANIAEDCQRIRVLRERERETAPAPRGESIGDAIRRLKVQGQSAQEMQELLDSLRIDMVFTAHPTEAKRRTTRRLLRDVRYCLQQADARELLPRERHDFDERLRANLTVLWQIDLMRPDRPTVMQEVSRGLFFTEELWEIVPQILQDAREALAESFPEASFRVPAFLQFGSWIGGDRDGNPFVTAEVTAETLLTLHQAAVNRHLDHCRELLRVLVMSTRQVAVPESLCSAIASAQSRWPETRELVELITPSEPHRRWLKILEFRLLQTLAASGPGVGTTSSKSRGPVYRTERELEADVELLADAISAHRGERIVRRYLEDWLSQIRTFGLHFAALDVRQDSRVHAEVLTELFRRGGITENYTDLDETARQAALEKAFEQLATSWNSFGDPTSYTGITRETLTLYFVLARAYWSRGPAPLGGVIVSMTHQPSDLLAVLWFWCWAWLLEHPQEANDFSAAVPYLPIIPLFETVADLRNGADVLESLLVSPRYAGYLAKSPKPEQIVMVGYSDSTKDGGYLSAGWGLHRAQEKLVEVTQRNHVRLVVFHGRGGALGRGGGPAARAIRSLPAKSVGGALRMTEQGEVLAERYDDPQIAHRHLEQVTWATMLVTRDTAYEPPNLWRETMEKLTDRSYLHYRELVELPGFLAYFGQATPISEIEHLPIGSRPARRRERRALSDLRAIPWTFAWTQSRQLIPAWYGLGTAVYWFIQEGGGDWSTLSKMYDDWQLFRALIDNADLALAKADMSIARRYADLAMDQEAGELVWQAIAGEFQLSRAAVLMIMRQPELLGGIPWLQRSIAERNPYVDPLNLIQIELIRRLTKLGDKAEIEGQPLREMLRQTIQGIAAGLRSTG